MAEALAARDEVAQTLAPGDLDWARIWLQVLTPREAVAWIPPWA